MSYYVYLHILCSMNKLYYANKELQTLPQFPCMYVQVCDYFVSTLFNFCFDTHVPEDLSGQITIPVIEQIILKYIKPLPNVFNSFYSLMCIKCIQYAGLIHSI